MDVGVVGTVVVVVVDTMQWMNVNENHHCWSQKCEVDLVGSVVVVVVVVVGYDAHDQQTVMYALDVGLVGGKWMGNKVGSMG